MCTAIVSHGERYLAGFDLDIDPAVWDYRLYCKNGVFYIGIRVGSTVYKVHGVNADGHFGVLPYRNGAVGVPRRGAKYQRVDLLVDRWLSGKYDYAELTARLQEKELVDAAGCSMHALFADREGHILLAEPGSGFRAYERRVVVTNYPMIEPPAELTNPFYGAERKACAEQLLSGIKEPTKEDIFAALRAAAQEGQWATRLSFVYDGEENAVYWCEERDFDHIRRFALNEG